MGRPMEVGIEKKNLFQIGHGRIAFYEHGGKTGRAMVKYPLYKKNAQQKYYPRIPRFDNRVV